MEELLEDELLLGELALLGVLKEDLLELLEDDWLLGELSELGVLRVLNELREELLEDD